MTKLVVANWKMNKVKKDVLTFFEEFNSSTFSHEAWIAPQFIHLDLALAQNKKAQKIGAQNCSHEVSGAFTGDTSAQALKDIGAQFVIIGHSERRNIFGETNAVLQKKTKLALDQGLTVIFCVGETLKEREANETFKVIENQLSEGLRDLGQYNPDQLVIAYEPVWAIGTGLNATKEQAEEVHQFIRKSYPKTKILYGGSVKPDNVKGFYQMPNIDGVLVGGASLKAQDFLALCTA